MRELERSVGLPREPTLAEGVAIRNAVASALVNLGADVTRVSGGALEFHMPAPWKTGRLNPLFAVTSGRLDVSAGAGAQRRVRYSLSFLRLHFYAAAAVIVTWIVRARWTRQSLLLTLGVSWLVVFLAPCVIAILRFRRFVVGAASSVMEATQFR